ncbi:MAG TPA: putative lipid II flippase FtsW, partial [Candidatus Nanopelagicales bacterium]|nr:putative lipid II flippase FtsW [Candidatus Nanopelagicales bacterium]
LWLQAVLDRPLTSFHLVLGSTSMLLALGLMMVLSASSVSAYLNFDDAYYYVKRQAVFLVIGVIGAIVLARLPHRVLRVLGWFAVALAAVLLILTYTALGFASGGNRNWIDLGFTSIQPSEFAKLAMIIWGADVLARKDRLLDQPRHLLFPYLPVCLTLILLVVFQGDAGTAVVLASIMVGVLFIVGAPIRVLAGLGLCAIGGVVTLFVTSPVRMRRLAAFLDPTADLNGANDQANAGMWAIASGGWWGLGLGGSRQKWGGLPVAHSDFIFAVIGEELGLFGSLMVLGLFLVLGYAGLRIATRGDDPFRRYAAGGVTVWLMVQALINLAVVLRLLPIAGVPLPLVSYGGSALIANLLAIGVLLSCARHEPDARRLLAARSRKRANRRVTAVVGSRRTSA